MKTPTTELLAQLKQATLDARAARFTRGPHGERLKRAQIEQLVGEVHVRINDLLDQLV